jgi:ankyrin repeat protein
MTVSSFSINLTNPFPFLYCSDLENHTPIHCCVGVKETPQHLQTLELLLSKGGDPNAEDDGKYTGVYFFC